MRSKLGQGKAHSIFPMKPLSFFESISLSAPFAAMISVLAQERLLGAALGSAFAGFVVFEQRKRIYASISESEPKSPSQYQVKEPIFGMQYRDELARLWNKTVDRSFGPVIQYLSSRGW